MSLKKNVVSNYISQLYIAAIGIAVVPMQVSYLGIESYGLVGFFAMIQTWFQLLDFGLTLTMVRATARFKSGAISLVNLKQLLRSMEFVFVVIAILGGGGICLFSNVIATRWLQLGELPVGDVTESIILMGTAVGIRWMSGLYRGVINGFEKLVWLGAFNIIIATFRFVIVLPYLAIFGATPIQFFMYQLGVCVVELILLVFKTKRLIPMPISMPGGEFSWQPLRDVIRFSISVAFTSLTWLLVSQSDKLLLSKILPLGEFAQFTLVVMMANGLLMISGPLNGALMPRMADLFAKSDNGGMFSMYHNATQLLCVFLIPSCLILAFYPEQVLWAWTGDFEISSGLSKILAFYSVGNIFLVLAGFPYQLQFANGDLRLHVRGSIIFVIFMVPSMIVATNNFGVFGASCVWLSVNIVYFMVWPAVIHGKFMPARHIEWLWSDIGRISIPTFIVACFLKAFVEWPVNRVYVALEIVMIGILLLFVAASASSFVRNSVVRKINC